MTAEKLPPAESPPIAICRFSGRSPLRRRLARAPPLVRPARRFFLLRGRLTGLAKAAIFGLIVAAISCAAGLSATGGAIGVGRAVRMAVVRCFLMLIIIGYYISWAFFR